jgi:hypothetical protein
LLAIKRITPKIIRNIVIDFFYDVKLDSHTIAILITIQVVNTKEAYNESKMISGK